MSITLRQIAVSGSAAAALLGGAAAITLADSPTASAATQTVAHRAITAPVTLPDGRTMRITGMGGYGHHATEAHVATVASFKADTATTPPGASDGVGTGLTPDGGVGAAITGPVNGTQTGVNQQITTQSAGGYIGAGIAAILLFSVIAIVRIRHGASKGDAALFLFLGIALAGTTIGTMLHQFATNGVGSLGGALGGL